MINCILNVLVFLLWVACVITTALVALLWLCTGYLVVQAWALFADSPVPAWASPTRMLHWTYHIQSLAPLHREEPPATPAPTPSRPLPYPTTSPDRWTDQDKWIARAWTAYCDDSRAATIDQGKSAPAGSRYGHDSWNTLPDDLREEYMQKTAPQLTSGQSDTTVIHDHSHIVCLLQADFDALPEYSTSTPTAVRPGNTWKHHNPRTGEWHRCTYTPTDKPDTVRITWERIVVRIPFIQQVLNGIATLEDIDDHIDQWHDLPIASAMPLAAWLGMTEWEYAAFVKSNANLPSIVAARKAPA